ncbi:MAG: hypothetical protein P8M25_03840 [Paracoccaceae bacterium]|jgi:exopolyphosphatase / guanosine-5'-triphosphate,3'-diphosphate pyrophosphatase|nr:hypothetical protein [Paracoccaceae bacterium]
MGITSLSAVATVAVREAEDGANFCAQIEHEIGPHILVIDGKQEARLAAKGVLLGLPRSYGLVCDIDGSSMELAEIFNGKVGKRQSSDLGPSQTTGDHRRQKSASRLYQNDNSSA